jgi:DNA invertase Pin-like site-specific DNA recombinase
MVGINMARYGYARVSTSEQSAQSQIDRLQDACCERIFTDHGVSGAKDERPALNDLRGVLQPGDTVVTVKADRLFRSLESMLAQLKTWEDQNITFECLDQPVMSTTDKSASGKLVRALLAAVAEFERDLIRDRTMEGRERAKARGQRMGRRPKLSKEQVAHAAELLEGGKTLREVAWLMRVDRQTVHRRVKAWRDGLVLSGQPNTR